MGITIPADRLAEVLDAAVTRAESDAVLSELWLSRVERIGECPSKTYVAALGTALLAKASDERVDALAVKSKAGPRAYSMRGVAKTLVEKAPIYGYHLGRRGPEPLNNQPWFGTDRVDRFENVRRDAMPYHRDLIRWLTELNALSEEEALDALAAFLRLRIAFAEVERSALARIAVKPASDLASLAGKLRIFINDDPEGGRRGQALVAALLDLAFDEVSLAPINAPTEIDVSVTEDGQLLLGIEVKQKPVEEATALHLAEEVASRGADKGLPVAPAPEQRLLDRERVRRQAFDEHGVLLAVWEGPDERVAQAALAAPLRASEFAAEAPAAYLRRMQSHGVSLEGQQYWSDLVAAAKLSLRASAIRAAARSTGSCSHVRMTLQPAADRMRLFLRSRSILRRIFGPQ